MTDDRRQLDKAILNKRLGDFDGRHMGDLIAVVYGEGGNYEIPDPDRYAPIRIYKSNRSDGGFRIDDLVHVSGVLSSLDVSAALRAIALKDDDKYELIKERVDLLGRKYDSLARTVRRIEKGA
jgi:hypothetical protein